MFQITRPLHVALFTATISIFAACAATVYDYLLLPGHVFDSTLIWRTLFAASLGFMVAIVVSIRMLNEHRLKLSLEYAVTYDALTGTYSRRAIFERLESQRPRPGVLILADIDHFKSINDTFGHATGDDVLRRFGAASKSFLHAEFGADRAAIGRIGGEEFLIHVDDAGIDGLDRWIEGLRRAIRDGPEIEGQDAITVTASYGVTLLDNRGIDQALVDADAALYRAKQTGRDRACVAHHIALPEQPPGTARKNG